MVPEINIPEYFQKYPYWLYWFFNKNQGKQGFSVHGTQVVWKEYQNYRLSYEELRNNWKIAKSTAKGVGFRLNQDENFILIDLDDCIDEHGNESEFLKDVLSKTPPNAYVQYSTRGKGIHIIGHGKINNPAWKRTKNFIGDYAVEMYDSNRFFVFTGKRHPKFLKFSDKLSNISDLAEYIAAKVMPEESTNGVYHALPPLESIQSVPKSQRHSSLIAYAGICVREGMPKTMAIPYLMQNLVPKFQRDSRVNNLTIDTVIKRELEDAYDYCAKKNLESNHLHVQAFPEYEIQSPIYVHQECKTLTLNEFLETEYTPKEHYLGPFVKQGISLVYAGTGVGKSHFCIGVGFAIASKGEFLGWKAEEKAKVLYIDGELPGYYLKSIVAPLYENARDKNIHFEIITPDSQGDNLMPDLSTKEGQNAVKKAVDKADVIFIDNLSTLVHSGKENEAEYWVPMQAWFLSLRRRGKSVIFAHHAGKGESGSYRGTSKITDAADLAVFLKKPVGHKAVDGCVFEVSFPKYRHFRKGDAVEFLATYTNTPGSSFWTRKDLEDVSSERIMQLHDTGLSAKEIAEDLDISLKTVYKWLKENGVEVKKSKAVKRSGNLSLIVRKDIDY